MKRIASAVLVLFVLLTVTSLVYGQVSVPNLVNFQGRLTDTSGVPVADGAYGVTFRLYTAPSGGSLAWAETSLVTTSNGVFTHQLGSANTLSSTFFQNYDSLFLEIVVGGETIAPRSRLTSSPYSRLSNGLEVWDDGNDTMVITTIPSTSRISTYGNGGAERFRLHGNNWAQLLMYDNNPSSDLTVALHANFNAGGQLDLNQEDGTSGAILRGGSTTNGSTLTMRDSSGVTTVSLDADLIGTGAAVLPADAISDLEILDEPGVASDHLIGPIVSASGYTTIASRTLTAPTSGYVLVIATCEAQVSHVASVLTSANFGVSTSSASLPGHQDFELSISAAEEQSGNWDIPVTVHGLFTVTAGATSFYFLIDKNTASGTFTINDVQLSLAFFPTAYGTVNPTLATGEAVSAEEGLSQRSALTVADIAAEQAEAASFNSARLEKELAEIKAQRAELEARIQRLEKQVDQTGPTQEIE